MTDFFSNKKPIEKPIFNLLEANEFNDIHLATLKVLEKTGVFVEDQQARQIFNSCGARVEKNTGIVRFPNRLVEDAISSAPSQIALAGRNPDYDLLVEDNKTAFVNFGGNINVTDPNTGIFRQSTKKDSGDAARLCDALEEINIYSRAVYALDQTPKLVHIHTADACFRNTAKHCLLGAESKWEVEKIIELAQAAVGGEINSNSGKHISFVTCVTSPLKLTQKFCEVVIASAGAGFATQIASMVMAGATGPVALAGSIVQLNAEILAGIVLAQCVRKGAAVIYSSYSTGMDLKVGTSPLGSPETAMLAVSVAGLCRYYQIPSMVPGISSDSKQPDIQAAYEKALTGVPATMTGANIVIGMGGIETGLTFDYGQAVLDDEFVRILRYLNKRIEVNEETLSVELIHEIGPFGEYLSHNTTLDKMKSFSQTQLFDRTVRINSDDTSHHSNRAKALSRAREILENHQPEPLSESAETQMQAILAEAEKESKNHQFGSSSIS